MSTPRTDAESEYVHESDGDGGAFTPRLIVGVGFACELERELQACHAVMEDMKAALEAYKPNSGIFTREQLRKKALASYANLKSQKP